MTNDIDQRAIVELIDREFSIALQSLKTFAQSVPEGLLYKRPPLITVGELILRSAAALEQTFGGLTANLWDDPFEWTLPETLSSTARIEEYLEEVDDARVRAFSYFGDDTSLLRYVSAPSGEQRQLLSMLLDALVRSTRYHGQAIATFKILSDVRPQGVII